MPNPETLYKSATPTESLSEYYELMISAAPEKGRGKFAFKELHGWWDESAKKPIHSLTTISPEEGLSYDEARKMSEVHRAYRAGGGFVHSFSIDYINGGSVYELIEVNAPSGDREK